MRFTIATILTLTMALAAYAVKAPGADGVVQNLPDGGNTTPELPCTRETYIDYIEKCTQQLDNEGDLTVEGMDKCMKDSGCPDFPEDNE
ncbi:hypothetical protein BDZ94DRAFT_1271977 [Collybia nuda]|uniref:Uncharacterized protein n=1 Tax=Collybia nuda TaxID=64659 RepID=A0A9P5XUQ6_9AGAR|nr:hypothetical protein BDZ94DRAFT_1271977 [Collybia nuda]